MSCRFLLLIFILFSVPTFGQDAQPVDTLLDKIEELIHIEKADTTNQYNLPIDSTAITVRKFDTLAIEQYKDSNDFNYLIKERKPSWLQKQLNRFLNWISRGKLNVNPTNFFGIMRILAILLLVGIVLWLILKLTGLNIFKFKGKKKKELEIPFEEIEKNIHSVDFDSLINKAIEQKNYRGAVRLLYLKSLRQLSDSQQINWQLHKTNREYLYEIENATTRNKFNSISNLFEYVWYGEFVVENNAFSQINDMYTDFFTSIKRNA